MTDASGPQGPSEPIPPNPAGESTDSGWSPDYQVSLGSEPAPRAKGRPWMALGAAALVILVIGGGALALRSFLSTSVLAAEIMAPDTEMFFSIDFLQLIEGDARKLNDTIISMVEESGEVEAPTMEDVDGFVDELNQVMNEELGVNFTDDIRPWVGRTVSLSLTGLEAAQSGGMPDVLFVVETRDGNASDQFLADLADGVARGTEADVAQATYGGVDMYIVSDDSDFEIPLVFARVGPLVAFGTRSAVEAAIDADAGTSLADNEGFASVMDSLPEDRVMSFYLDVGAVTSALESEGLEGMDQVGYEDVGASLSVTDYGIRVDTVVLGDDLAGAFELESGDVVANLPQETRMMLSGWSVAPYWDLALNTPEARDAVDDFLLEAEAELGLDIDGFLRALDAPSALALVESQSGLIPAEFGAPVGLVGIFGTTRPDEVTGYLETLVDYLTANGLEIDQTAPSMWAASAGADEAVTFGVAEEFLVVASSGDLADSVGGSPTLADNAAFVSVAETIDVDPASVVFYLDLQGMLELFEAPPEVTDAVQPLGAMAASYDIQDDRALGVFVWMIDYVDSE